MHYTCTGTWLIHFDVQVNAILHIYTTSCLGAIWHICTNNTFVLIDHLHPKLFIAHQSDLRMHVHCFGLQQLGEVCKVFDTPIIPLFLFQILPYFFTLFLHTCLQSILRSNITVNLEFSCEKFFGILDTLSKFNSHVKTKI